MYIAEQKQTHKYTEPKSDCWGGGGGSEYEIGVWD